MQPGWRSQWRKWFQSHKSYFKMGRENIFTSFELLCRANHSMDAPSEAAREPVTVCVWKPYSKDARYLCCFLLYYLFQEASLTTVDFQWICHCFGIQSTMQGEGWSIVMSNSSVGVPSSVGAGLHRTGCPATLCRATGPLTAGWNLLIHIRKHQPYHMYIWHDLDPEFDIIWIFHETVDILGLREQLISLRSCVKEPVFIHLVMELTQRQTDGWTYQLG